MTGLLAAYDDAYLLTTIAGGMRLDEYLRTRIFELVVHGLDIQSATGIDPAFDQEPWWTPAPSPPRSACGPGRGGALLLAVTGRSTLAADFTIV